MGQTDRRPDLALVAQIVKKISQPALTFSAYFQEHNIDQHGNEI